MWMGAEGAKHTVAGLPQASPRTLVGPISDPEVPLASPLIYIWGNPGPGGQCFLPKVTQGEVAESGQRFTTFALLHHQYKSDGMH